MATKKQEMEVVPAAPRMIAALVLILAVLGIVLLEDGQRDH
jgi:hypothetical protein